MRAFALLAFPLLLALAPACSEGGPATAASTTTGAGGSPTSSSAGSTTTGAGVGGAASVCGACDGACVDLGNDPFHCGACDITCTGSTPLCDHGQCQKAPCEVVGPICPNDLLCCGMECCPSWKRCCRAPGSDLPTCIALDAGACPTPCSGCGS